MRSNGSGWDSGSCSNLRWVNTKRSPNRDTRRHNRVILCECDSYSPRSATFKRQLKLVESWHSPNDAGAWKNYSPLFIGENKEVCYLYPLHQAAHKTNCRDGHDAVARERVQQPTGDFLQQAQHPGAPAGQGCACDTPDGAAACHRSEQFKEGRPNHSSQDTVSCLVSKTPLCRYCASDTGQASRGLACSTAGAIGS